MRKAALQLKAAQDRAKAECSGGFSTRQCVWREARNGKPRRKCPDLSQLRAEFKHQCSRRTGNRSCRRESAHTATQPSDPASPHQQNLLHRLQRSDLWLRFPRTHRQDGSFLYEILGLLIFDN